MAAITNDHKLGGLKIEIYSVLVLKARSSKAALLGKNQDVSKAALLLATIGKNLFLACSSASGC